MKAKCPACFGEKSDCEKCSGTGFIDARFAEGILWTRDCQNPQCGRNIAGSIRLPGELPRPKDDYEHPEPCLFCGGETKWTICGDANECLT